MKTRHKVAAIALWFVFLLGLCFVVCRLVSTQTVAVLPFTLDYSREGGFSPFKFVAVHVKGDGSVAVSYQYWGQGHQPVTYSFALNRREIADLVALVDAVGFFDQPANDDTVFVTDVGKTSLSVAIGERRRTLTYGHRPELAPLNKAICELFGQGVVTTELREKGDTYQAMCAACPRMVARKVYCPRLLVDPLKEAIRHCTDRQKLEWGLVGLAWLQPPDQWRAYPSEQLAVAGAERKAMLLGILVFDQLYRGIPDTHTRVLLPLLTEQLDAFAEKKEKIDPKVDQALGTVCEFFGCEFFDIKEYRQVLPALSRLIKVHGDSVAGGWARSAVRRIKAGTNQ